MPLADFDDRPVKLKSEILATADATQVLGLCADRDSPTFADRTPAGKMKFELSFCVCARH
jgi:hypothetical protein